MKAVEALIHRVSSPRLIEPAPSEEQLDILFRSALRAPDHALLRPWRYIVIEGDARTRLGQMLADAARIIDPTLDEKNLARYHNMPLRAPMLVALVLSPEKHPKVPEIEQVLSLGAAVHGLETAAYALGIGAMWRTGSVTYTPSLAKSLDLQGHEKLLGFVYLGTPAGPQKKLQDLNPGNFVTRL